MPHTDSAGFRPASTFRRLFSNLVGGRGPSATGAPATSAPPPVPAHSGFDRPAGVGGPALVPAELPLVNGVARKLGKAPGRDPVFLRTDGQFTLRSDGRAPATLAELGDALYGAAELLEDGLTNDLTQANLPTVQRKKVFEQLTKVYESCRPDGAPADGITPEQAIQLRACLGTILLHALEASPEPELASGMLQTYSAWAQAETEPHILEQLAAGLDVSAAAQSAEVRKVADALVEQTFPVAPPYDVWFANGNTTLNIDQVVGRGQFWEGFTAELKKLGFKPVGAENPHGVTRYEWAVNKPGVGPTRFVMDVREGGTDILRNLDNPKIGLFDYDGHSNYGRNLSTSLRTAPAVADGGAGRVLFANLCVGKGMLDRLKKGLPHMQVITTYGSSRFWLKPGTDKMSYGEGTVALKAYLGAIAERASYEDIQRRLDQAVGRELYLTPAVARTRRRVLDADFDGQADYLDKLYNYNLFRVPEDTQRELSPIKQSRPADKLDGTKVLSGANSVNNLCEFNQMLLRVNEDSKVIPNGFFDPDAGDERLVRFIEQKDGEGKLEYRMELSSRYSHMSEEMTRMVCNYEFNRYVMAKQPGVSKLDAKLNGLAIAAKSALVDESSRDVEMWSAFCKRFNLPAVEYGTITRLLEAEAHYHAGGRATLKGLQDALSPAQLAELNRDETGVPTRLV